MLVRPAPFLLGLSYAALGLGLSALAVRETRDHAQLEAASHHSRGELTDQEVFRRTSLTDPALSSASQAGMVNNLNDGLAWGLFPILFATSGMPRSCSSACTRSASVMGRAYGCRGSTPDTV